MTLTELNTGVASLVQTHAVANLSISLPVETDLTDFSVGGAIPTIALTDGDLFDSDTTVSGTLNDFAALNPFTQMSASQFQSALESVTNVFEEVDTSNLLSAEIVLTNGQTLQQLVDISDVFTNEVLAGLINPGSLELAVSDEINAWKAITDGSFGLSVDGEDVKLTELDFSGVTSLNDVAAVLQTAINNSTREAANVVVSFASSVSRTDNDGNTTTVAVLTISSTGLTSNAAVTSPGTVEDTAASVGTALYGGVISDGGAIATAAQPKYANIQEFRDLIKSLTSEAVQDVIFVPASEDAPAGLKFAFSAAATFDQVSRDLNLRLPTDVLTNLSSDGLVELTADIVAAGTIQVGLTPVSGSFELTPATTLTSLNAAQGVLLNREDRDSSSDGETDIQVALKDGTTFEVNFDNATTVQDILNAFNGNSANANKATLSIAADKLRLQIEDHTTGNDLLSVSAINGSLAGFSLGLTGTASAEDDTNTEGNEATTISGAALHGLTVADHVRLSDVSIAPRVHLEAQTIDATGRSGGHQYSSGQRRR